MRNLFLIGSAFALSFGLYGQMKLRMHTTLQSSGASKISATTSPSTSPLVSVSERGDYIFIKGNGIPNHKVGAFPNSGNPNAITDQSYEFKVTKNPKVNSSPSNIEMRMNFGVALNGVPFDPAAAEWYQGQRNSQWQYDALSGAVSLGIDENHAHVQPTGAYHYHGLPTNLLSLMGVRAGSESPLIGYAADGHPIYALYGEGGKEQKSSFKIKSGNRPIGGVYDGTFVADYEYVSGAGDLDECNGKMFKGSYAYFLTRDFPVIPRCFRGSPDSSFRKDEGNTASNSGGAMHSHSHGPGPGPGGMGRRGGPPKEAIQACQGKSKGSSCSFQGRRGSVRGTCFSPPSGSLACRP